MTGSIVGNRRSLVAEIVSEVGGPSPLLLIALLEVGLPHGAVLATIISIITMAVVPYLSTVWLARAGKLSSGRFVSDRRQRMPILVGTLVLVIAGAIASAVLGAPRELVWLSVLAVIALAVVTIVTLRWKISVHATIAVFFAGLQVVLFGPVGVVAAIIPACVVWARYRLRAHTMGQLAAGSVLGALLALTYCLVAG